MRTYALTGGGLVAALLLSAMPAAAQQNPFVPPSSGGLSKAQVQAIIRAEVARQGAQSGAPAGAPAADGGVTSQMKGGGKPALPGSGAAAAVGALPSQGGGAPTGVSTATTGAGGRAVADPNDVVGQLVSDGGQFVGCVSATPVFKDKDGRRAYFTSKELKASNVAKRIARCG